MTALLLLHGFLGAPASWDAVRRALPQAHDVWAPALAGHTLAALAFADELPSADEDAGFALEVERIVSLARQRGFRRGTVCGYSLGARVALGVALRAPELCARLVLVSGHPGLADPSERRARTAHDAELAERLLSGGLAAFVNEWERQPLFTSQKHLPEAAWSEQRALRLSHHPALVAEALRRLSLGRMPHFVARLGELALPVHLLVGSLDTKFVSLAANMQRYLPNSSIEVVAGAGHNLLLERPDAVAAALCSTL